MALGAVSSDNVTMIVAFGGGSAMDAAKVMAAAVLTLWLPSRVAAATPAATATASAIDMCE